MGKTAVSSQYKTIPDFFGYEINEEGLVRSWRAGGKKDNIRKTPLILKHKHFKNGYKYVHLIKNNKSFAKTIHRLVLLTFKGACPTGKESRHLDGNKENVNLKNLEWGTKKENYKDKLLHKSTGVGELSERALLTTTQIKEILILLQNDELSQSKIGKLYNVKDYVINQIKRNITYTDVLPEIREQIKKISPKYNR